VCIDGKPYWIKRQAQQGLSAELIAGRLAARLDVGGRTEIVHVPKEALPGDGSADHLEGLGVGIQHLRDTVNAREISQLTGGKNLTPGLINQRSHAAVVAFQSWIGVGDSQVLIDMTRGLLYSIDHGDAFGDLTNTTPTLIVTDIPGIPHAHGTQGPPLEAAIARVEGVEDQEILTAVAKVPVQGPDWNGDQNWRLQIAHWLAERRDRLEAGILP
jgi:hypothetical protein